MSSSGVDQAIRWATVDVSSNEQVIRTGSYADDDRSLGGGSIGCATRVILCGRYLIGRDWRFPARPSLLSRIVPASLSLRGLFWLL